MIWNAIGAFLNLLGSGVKGFFGLKGDQAKVVQKALDIVGDVNQSDDARAIAAAQIIANEARSESVITRVWRPLTVLAFVAILIMHFMGLTLVNLNDVALNRLFDIVEYAVLGYMGMRSADKWVRDLSLSKVLRTFIEKKLG